LQHQQPGEGVFELGTAYSMEKEYGR
jgi:hypothetical protein